jgi:hypothetical protein
LNSFVNGADTTDLVRYEEVGIIEITANVAGGDYLGAGAARTTKMISRSGYVGRFVPEDFALSDAVIAPFCPGVNAFTYMQQPFTVSYRLTARNLAGGITTNYRDQFVKLDHRDLDGDGLRDPLGSLSFGAVNNDLEALSDLQSAPTQAVLLPNRLHGDAELLGDADQGVSLLDVVGDGLKRARQGKKRIGRKRTRKIQIGIGRDQGVRGHVVPGRDAVEGLAVLDAVPTLRSRSRGRRHQKLMPHGELTSLQLIERAEALDRRPVPLGDRKEGLAGLDHVDIGADLLPLRLGGPAQTAQEAHRTAEEQKETEQDPREKSEDCRNGEKDVVRTGEGWVVAQAARAGTKVRKSKGENVCDVNIRVRLREE